MGTVVKLLCFRGFYGGLLEESLDFSGEHDKIGNLLFGDYETVNFEYLDWLAENINKFIDTKVYCKCYALEYTNQVIKILSKALNLDTMHVIDTIVNIPLDNVYSTGNVFIELEYTKELVYALNTYISNNHIEYTRYTIENFNTSGISAWESENSYTKKIEVAIDFVIKQYTRKAIDRVLEIKAINSIQLEKFIDYKGFIEAFNEEFKSAHIVKYFAELEK